MKQFIVVSLEDKKLLGSFRGDSFMTTGNNVFTVLENKQELVYPNLNTVFSVIEYNKEVPDDLKYKDYYFAFGEIVGEL